jgi:hypothetical protein
MASDISARAMLASEASGQRGNFIVRAPALQRIAKAAASAKDVDYCLSPLVFV